MENLGENVSVIGTWVDVNDSADSGGGDGGANDGADACPPVEPLDHDQKLSNRIEFGCKLLFELIKQKYSCTHRGEVEIKGKKKVDMYLVD